MPVVSPEGTLPLSAASLWEPSRRPQGPLCAGWVLSHPAGLNPGSSTDSFFRFDIYTFISVCLLCLGFLPFLNCTGERVLSGDSLKCASPSEVLGMKPLCDADGGGR